MSDEKIVDSDYVKSGVYLSGHLDFMPARGVLTHAVEYHEPAWDRKFDASLTDRSMYVPLANQVRALMENKASGIVLGSGEVTDSDYTFRDGKIPSGVALSTFTALDGVDDVAELSAYKDSLVKEINGILDKEKNKATIKQLNEIIAKLEGNRLSDFTQNDVDFLSKNGITVNGIVPNSSTSDE